MIVDQWCAFILTHMKKQDQTFTGLARDVRSSRCYLSRLLNRSVHDLKPKGVSLELAHSIMKSLGVSWSDFDEFLIESEVQFEKNS